MGMFLKHSLSTLFLGAVLVGDAAAQSNAQVATDAAKAEEVSESATAEAAPTKVKAKAGVPEGNGRWVPRVNKTTCPRGSETYIDEKDGGVKCWVNSATD